MSDARDGAFGHLQVISLESADLLLTMVPELGGRVTSLRDRHSGREWLVQGTPPTPSELTAWRRETAVFGLREAYGWDECLPTVAPANGPIDPDGPPLRDHGAQWARSAAVRVVPGTDGRMVATRWNDTRWPLHLERRLRLEDRVIHAAYALVNASAVDLPVLWSMHALLELEPGSRFELPQGTSVTLSQEIGTGLEAAPLRRPTPWPVVVGSPAVDLSVVQAGGAGFATKLYADPAPPGPVGATTPDGASIMFSWTREHVPAVGLWIDAGGWPAGSGATQVAIEPTTSGHDDLDTAMASGRALLLRAGERICWDVTIEVRGTPAAS